MRHDVFFFHMTLTDRLILTAVYSNVLGCVAWPADTLIYPYQKHKTAVLLPEF